MRPIWITTFVTLLAVLPATRAYAFDYIEHLWFTDDACQRAQNAIAAELEREPGSARHDRGLLGRAYLALALSCPLQDDEPYCSDGAKRARGHISDPPPEGSRRYSVTLGDFSALGDHVSRQGPVQNLPRAGERGLVHEMLRWLTGKSRKVGGPIGDVAEDACEVGDLADFDGVRRDIDAHLTRWRAERRITSIPPDHLVPLARAEIARGPHDPAMKYSFDNPHYLDLVLRNHHHFGDAAHDAWNGFHSTATAVRARTCADLVAVDADEAEDLADAVPGYEDVRWGRFDETERAQRVCGMLRDAGRSRVLEWASVAGRSATAPIAAQLALIRGDDPDRVFAQIRLLDGLVVDLMSLVMEGTGLHYVQDGLAAGHMRTIRSREALVEVRHDHDADNRDGVAAVLDTTSGRSTFVAWGDGYMLGRPPTASCDPARTEPEAVSTCLLAHQRGLVAAVSTASLVDWAVGGAIYSAAVDCDDPLEGDICMSLPLRAPSVAGAPQAMLETTGLLPGALPVPPPNFSFESLSFSLSYGPWEQTPALSLRFAAFSELAQPAHWLRSFQFRAQTELGQGPNQTLELDGGYGFHYRFYARVVLDLVPLVFVGIRDFADGVDTYAGLMPRFGFTLLPEGWTRIPVEFSLFVEHPLVFFASDTGFFNEVGDHLPRIGLGFGLAFMH